jgi:hypothetical protein
MPASHFQDFCRIFIEFFEDESDPQKRWKHVACLLVEEVTRPATLGVYVGDDAYEHLRGNMRPVLKQEGLSGIGSAFFGGVNDSDTELLLEQVELFLEDPDGYEMPELPGLQGQEEEEDPNN